MDNIFSVLLTVAKVQYYVIMFLNILCTLQYNKTWYSSSILKFWVSEMLKDKTFDENNNTYTNNEMLQLYNH